MRKKMFAAVGIAAVAAAAVGVYRSADGVVGSRGLLGRNLTMARLGARTGRRFAVHQARRTFASAKRRDELDRTFELRTAQDVTDALGNLKGALMKVGQMASYLDVGMPENLRITLAQLQQDAPPMSAELAASMIESEFGAPPSTVFAEWDPVPIASASIGQVHRAITHDGHAVAVKVQYPGIDDAVGSDLRNTDSLFSGLRLLFPGLQAEPIVAELKARLIEELDYTIEARNQQRFATYFAGHPYIDVPAVHLDLSSRRVLTTDLATGARFDEVVDWSKTERDLAAETLYRFSFGSIYRLHAFNGDPHPGNYLFRPGGQVTFLDFGLVKHFTEDETALFQELIRAMVIERDYAGFRAIAERAGLMAPGASFTDDEVGAYFSHFYAFVLDDEPVTFDQEYAAAGIGRIFDATDDDGELKRVLNVPPAFVIIQRINLGLMSLFGRLEATNNWRRIAEELWPFVDRSPATPMGREIATWRASTGERGGV